MRSAPPAVWRRLLSQLLPADVRDEVLADLDHIWELRRSEGGRLAADRWYRAQTLRAVGPSLAAFSGRDAVETVARDLRHAVRQLVRRPGVGGVVVLTLALGIGATTAVFSAVHGVLLRPLPYERPGEIVMVTSRAGGSDVSLHVSGPDAMELAGQVPSVQAVAGFGEATVGPLTGVERPEHVLTVPVTWNVFHVLGVDVTRGRAPLPEDGSEAVGEGAADLPTSAVISHDFWVRSFGGDPDAVGRVVRIWGRSTRIVGVLPEGFRLVVPPELNIPPHADVWEVFRRDLRDWPREGRWLRTVARLERGTTVTRAEREVDAFAARLREAHAHHAAEGTELRVESLQAAAAAPLERPLLLLMGAVVVVLLVACANVANLLLARGAVRADEMALRSHLGAPAGRLVRQLVTESALLAALGAAGGVLLAKLCVGLLHAVRPTDLHRLEAVRLDLPVLAFAVLVAGATTLLAGLLPALRTARAGTARLGARGGSGVPRRTRAALAVGEIALTVVLLVGAGLLMRTFAELQRMPLGFDPEGVLTVTTTQPLRPAEERRAYEAEVRRAAESVPGVTGAAIVFPLPMNGVYERSAEYAPDGREHDPAAWNTVYFRTASPSYFDVMGLALESGRPLGPEDEDTDVPVVVVDERLAARAFPGRSPVGRRLWLRGMGEDTLRAEIVGVVEHAPQWDHRDRRPTVYLPRTFYRSHEVALVAKVAGDPAHAAPRLAEAVRRVDPTLPYELSPMESFVRERLARSRFLSVLMEVFGGIALALSAVGLYGVLSYSVRTRTREIGVRVALGAQGGQLVRGVVAGGLRLAGVGIAVGAVGALLLGRALEGHLFGVEPLDPRVMLVTVAVVLAAAIAASALPAVRAGRVDPVTAMRAD